MNEDPFSWEYRWREYAWEQEMWLRAVESRQYYYGRLHDLQRARIGIVPEDPPTPAFDPCAYGVLGVAVGVKTGWHESGHEIKPKRPLDYHEGD